MVDLLYRTFAPLGMLHVLPFLERRRGRGREDVLWPRPRRRGGR